MVYAQSLKNQGSDLDSAHDLSELEKIEEFYDLLEKNPKVSEHNYLNSASFSIFQASINRISEKNIDERLDNNFNHLKPKKLWLGFESSQKPLEDVIILLFFYKILIKIK